MRLEDNLQIACVKWFRLQHPKYIITQFPAGNVFSGDDIKRKRTGKRMKDLGYENGTPDLLILHDNGNILFIEVKTLTGRQSASQKEFQRKAQELGHNYEVVRSLNEFIMTINKHFKK